MEYLRIANWDSYQHYKKKNPRWVKLYLDTFNRPNWVALDDKSKLLMLICIGIGGVCDGKIPNCAKTLQKISHLRRKIDLKPLIDIGFLIPCSIDFIDREETEKRREEKTKEKTNVRNLTEEERFELAAMIQYRKDKERSLAS